MLISASLTVSLSLLSLSVSISSLPHWSPKPAASQELSSAEQDHFHFFIFFLFFQGKLWEPESTAQRRCQPPSPLVSIFFLSHVFFFLIWVVVFTSSERITVEPAPFVSVLPSEGLFSHVFFSALCFFPLKHAPLIFSEEDQAG